jgi:hypothetical protein
VIVPIGSNHHRPVGEDETSTIIHNHLLGDELNAAVPAL